MLRKVNSGRLYNSFIDIIDCESIIVKVNLKARGFTEFMEITLPLHIFNIYTRNWNIFCIKVYFKSKYNWIFNCFVNFTFFSVLHLNLWHRLYLIENLTYNLTVVKGLLIFLTMKTGIGYWRRENVDWRQCKCKLEEGGRRYDHELINIYSGAQVVSIPIHSDLIRNPWTSLRA